MTDVRTIGAKEIAQICVKRAKSDKDAVIGITGDEGEGKSTLSIWLIVEILALNNGWTDEEKVQKAAEVLNDYIIYSPNKDEIQKKIISLPKYSPISADEAIKVLYKLNWQTEVQKTLNMLYAICRKENKITMLCMPRFIDFNEFFRNHRIKFWIHVLSRGHAVLFTKDWSPFSKDPWWIDHNQKSINDLYYKKFGSNKMKVVDFDEERKLRTLEGLRIFVSRVTFNDMPKELEKVYLVGKKDAGYEQIAESRKGSRHDELWKKRLMGAINLLVDKGANRVEVLNALDMNDISFAEFQSRARKDLIGITNNLVVKVPHYNNKVMPKPKILEDLKGDNT